MMKLTNISTCVLILLILASCSSSKHMPPSPPVIVNNTDSVRIEYIETLRIDTVTVEIPIPAESAKQAVSDSTSHLETSIAESDAWINPDGTLGHSIKNKEKGLKTNALVPVKDAQTNNTKVSVKEIPVPYPEPVYIERDFTKWESFRLGAFWYLVTAAILSCVWILRKPLTTVIKKCF